MNRKFTCIKRFKKKKLVTFGDERREKIDSKQELLLTSQWCWLAVGKNTVFWGLSRLTNKAG